MSFSPMLYLCHGWGYDASFWQPLLAQLPGWKSVAWDAGYFGPPHLPAFPSIPWLAVGHSAGVQELLTRFETGLLPAHCLGVASLNGFARFSHAPDFPEGIPERVLARMSRQLGRAPLQVLEDFRTLCGETIPSHNLPSTPDVVRLQKGLEKLISRDCRPLAQKPALEKHLFSLVGAADSLAPARLGVTESESQTVVPEGGHLLPRTHPEFCAAWLKQIWDHQLSGPQS